MKKICISNLGMIVTEKCNLNCAHCMRGKCTNKVMSDIVIEKTLDQIKYIGNLAICGGEPTLALDRLEKIFSYVIEKKIIVEQVSLVINGTIYSLEFLRLLDYIDKYVNYNSIKKSLSTFTISHDKYHYNEILSLKLEKEYLENIKKYSESKHYYGLQGLPEKVFREGNAINLDLNYTIPFRPPETIMTYTGKNMRLDKKNGLCFIGPLVTVNVDGIVTECDASIENQRNLYNYGNILTDSIEDIFLKKNTLILRPRKWHKESKKIIENYSGYNE